MRWRIGGGAPVAANRNVFYLIACVIFTLGACAPGGAGGGKVVATLTVTEANSTRKVSADGALEAVRQTPVAPLVQGKVETVLVENGETVTAGQELFQIDSADLQAQLDALESGGSSGGGSSSSSSKKSQTQEQSGPSMEEQIAQITKGLTDMQTAVTTQITALETIRKLITEGPLAALAPANDPAWTALNSQIVYQEAQLSTQLQTTALQTQTQLLQIQTGLQGDGLIAQSNAAFAGAIGGAFGGLASAGSGSNPQLTAQQTALERQIRDTTVKAPTGGIVAFASLQSSTGLSALGGGSTAAAAASAAGALGTLHPGALLQAGQTVLSIYDLAAVRLKVGIDEVDITTVKEGQQVEVSVDAFPDAQITGTVSRIDVNPTVSDSGGITYVVKVDIPVDKVPGWRPGMTASADILVDEGGNGVDMPTSAIVPEGDTDYVFLVKNGKAVKTEVTTRKTSTGVVVIGLHPGDVVVTNGASDLKDGDSVSTGAK